MAFVPAFGVHRGAQATMDEESAKAFGVLWFDELTTHACLPCMPQVAIPPCCFRTVSMREAVRDKARAPTLL